MSKSQFKGEIPEHLLSSDALARRARREQERQEFVPFIRRMQELAYSTMDACRKKRGTAGERRAQATAVVKSLTTLFRDAPFGSQKADIASQLPTIACNLFAGKALDVEHLREQLMSLDLLDPASMTGGKPMFERRFDESMRKVAKACDLSQEDSDMLRSVMVEAGLTSLADIPRADLRHSVIGAALTQNPARISELKHLDAFLDVALRFQIDVELPTDLSEARAAEHKASVLQQSMQASGCSAADPLAHASPPARRRMRA